jgi:hypothetical protein
LDTTKSKDYTEAETPSLRLSAEQAKLRSGPAYNARFTFAIAIVFLLQFIVVFTPPLTDDASYLASIIDKDQRLREIQGPRILLVGGSNLSFGVDSIALQDELGLPVLNMSLCSPIGLRFMLKHVEKFIHPGDLVVLSPEYSHYGELQDGGPELLEMLSVFPGGLAYLSPENVPALFNSFAGIFQRKLEFWKKFGMRSRGEDVIYRRNGLNGHGDVITHLHVKGYQKLNPNFKCIFLEYSPEIWLNTIKFIADFNRVCKLSGARVFYAFPPIPVSTFEVERAASINSLARTLEDKTNITLLSSPAESVYPNSAFFSTLYHLAAAARNDRTKRLIQQLKPFISQKALQLSTLSKQTSVTVPETKLPRLLRGPADIVRGDYKVGIGSGWYPTEGTSDPFRWVNNDAEIWLPLWQGNAVERNLTIEFEPGPALGHDGCLLTVLDGQHKKISEFAVAGRKTIKFELPQQLCGKLITLHVDSSNLQTKNDPRILNFRVFNLAIHSGGHL